MDIHKNYEAMRDRWHKTDDDSELQKFFKSEDYRSMSYVEKNRGFITGSKAKIFATDEHWYEKMYIEEERPPHVGEEETPDYFAIGSAVDELLTHGEKSFEKNYEVMSIRVTDVDQAILDQEEKIAKAKLDLKKDGERGATGIKTEEKAIEKIKYLKTLKGKTQLSHGDAHMVHQIVGEFRDHPLIDDKPNKKFIVTKIGGVPVKAEFDNYVEHFTDPVTGEDVHAIRDLKTTANIVKAGEWAKGDANDSWCSQLAMYQLLLEEQTFKNEPVWDSRPICGIIDAVDKHGGWSRGRPFYYSPKCLKNQRGVLLEKIVACHNAEKTGKFFRSKDFQPDCPFYGVDGYGRDTKFHIVG